jgi:hypothetical protein
MLRFGLTPEGHFGILGAAFCFAKPKSALSTVAVFSSWRFDNARPNFSSRVSFESRAALRRQPCVRYPLWRPVIHPEAERIHRNIIQAAGRSPGAELSINQRRATIRLEVTRCPGTATDPIGQHARPRLDVRQCGNDGEA